nr:hypothetical protein [uncultured bacterium]
MNKTVIALTVVGVLVLAAIGGYVGVQQFKKRNRVPVVYDDIVEHYKYGSIGTEARLGLPRELFDVLPEQFADLLPPGPGQGWERIGFLYEPGHDLPIGASVRELPVALVGLNCAACHTGTVRAEPGGARQIVLGAPANNFDGESYLRFIFAVVADPRFQPGPLIEAIERHNPKFGFIDKLLYRFSVIPTMKQKLGALSASYHWLDVRPPFGPGRIDTFNPYKVLFGFDMTEETAVGTVDLPALFDQRIREGMHLHWDGNNTSLSERNKSAAIGAGANPDSLDLPAMDRIEKWILDRKPPAFPVERIDKAKAARGEAVWNRTCANCHEPGKPLTGTVIPIDDVKTDRQRLDSFTPELTAKMDTIGEGYPWRFSHFVKTNGYAAPPLDGIWVRSPYLHNGSVPTLHALLFPAERSATFYRRYDVFDWSAVGYVTSGAEAEKVGFKYDTTLRGNGNNGHLYGTELTTPDKEDLIEYLKTL